MKQTKNTTGDLRCFTPLNLNQLENISESHLWAKLLLFELFCIFVYLFIYIFDATIRQR